MFVCFAVRVNEPDNSNLPLGDTSMMIETGKETARDALVAMFVYSLERDLLGEKPEQQHPRQPAPQGAQRLRACLVRLGQTGHGAAVSFGLTNRGLPPMDIGPPPRAEPRG